MSNKADPQGVRKLLDQTRNQRNQFTRGAPLPIDTAHFVGACPQCGRLGNAVLGFLDPPYGRPQGQIRFRNAVELERFLVQLISEADPKNRPRMATPEEEQKGTCECGAALQPREVMAVRLMHAMPGTGAELIAEGVRGGSSMLVSSSGQSMGGDGFEWKLYRAPVDGTETEIASSFDDSAIERAFGRTLTLAHLWKRILDAAKSGTESLEQVEPGYWIYAGPKDDKGLAKKIKDAIGGNADRGDYPLVSLGKHGPMPMGAAWPQWAFEHAQAIANGVLRAGTILDRGAVRTLVTGQLGRQNVGFREDADGNRLVAQVGEVQWPVEVLMVALGSAHLGWTLAETVAAAVGDASARVNALQEFLIALRKARPEAEFKVEGMRATPKRKDGTFGRPIDLMTTAFRLKPGTPEFEREVRFICDEIPKDADPTKLCPCGTKAFVAARLFPWSVVEDFKRATAGKEPQIVGKWPEESPKAALLATISCDLHIRIPGAAEIEQAGLAGDKLEKRLSEDLSNLVFAVQPTVQEDKNKKSALIAYGPLVASVVMNDHLVSALHAACGRPFKANKVEAQVTTPNLLCMYEEGFDDELLDKMLEMGAARDGIAPGAATPFSLTWDVALDAAPVGRFVDLFPQPQQGQQAPGAKANPARPNAGSPSGRPPAPGRN